MFGADKANSVTVSLPVTILEVTGSLRVTTLPVPILIAYAASRRGPAAAANFLGGFRIG